MGQKKQEVLIIGDDCGVGRIEASCVSIGFVLSHVDGKKLGELEMKVWVACLEGAGELGELGGYSAKERSHLDFRGTKYS